jgi:hypothetical protein
MDGFMAAFNAKDAEAYRARLVPFTACPLSS